LENKGRFGLFAKMRSKMHQKGAKSLPGKQLAIHGFSRRPLPAFLQKKSINFSDRRQVGTVFAI